MLSDVTIGYPRQGQHSAPRGRLLVLDGLRGVAAFAVINDHVPSETLRMLTPGRYLAVDFFWVLSGFVLALSYDGRLRSQMSAWAFMRLRIIRLYPFYLLGLVIGLVVAMTLSISGWRQYSEWQVLVVAVVGATFLPFPQVFSWTGLQLFPLNGPSWTLFFELVVNLIYGLIVRVLYWKVLAILLMMAAAVTFLTVPNAGVGGPGWLWPHFIPGLARAVYCFFMGVLLFHASRIIRVPAMPAWGAFLAFLAIVAMPVSDSWRGYYDVFAALVAMPLLVVLSAGARVDGRVASACAVLGQISYGVYVLHVPLWSALEFLLEYFQFNLPGLVLVVVVSVAAGVTAWVGGRYYDMPMRRKLSGKG